MNGNGGPGPPKIPLAEFDYVAAVDAMDNSGYDWGGLFQATQDPGFGQLSGEHQEHLTNLLQVKVAKATGVRAEPYAATGELGGLRQAGQVFKGLIPGMGLQAGLERGQMRKRAVEDYVAQGNTRDEARALASMDLHKSMSMIAKQFTHYLTGGFVAAPEERKDPFVANVMESRVKPLTQASAIGAQFVVGSGLLGVVSKVPLISARAANLSAMTRGMIKGGILDFGITAAIPTGLPQEEAFGISDDIARAIAPEGLDPTSTQGRLLYGVGGLIEGGIIGSVMYGIGYGVKLADAKYAFTMTAKQQERILASLKAAGVDVTNMGKRDAWLTYRTRMLDMVQGIDEAVFNGQRMSAEQWLAQAFLADPNVTELTAQEGRILWGIFSTNKGGMSIIRGVDDPSLALQKLKNLGIHVDAHVIPRNAPPPDAAGGAVGAKIAPTEPPAGPAPAAGPGTPVEPTPSGAPVTPIERVEGAAATPVVTTPAKKPKGMPSAVFRARKLIGDEEFNKRVRQQMGNRTGDTPQISVEEAEKTVAADALKDRPAARVHAATKRAVEAERRAADAERAATTDPLTGIQNRTAWERAKPRVDGDSSLEVVAIDMSDFKGLNDTQGHKAGDEALKAVGTALQRAVTKLPNAQVFRVGGDEFVVVVPKGEGLKVIRRAQKGLPEIKYTAQGKEFRVGIRGGVGNTYAEADAAERLKAQTRKGARYDRETGAQPTDVPPPAPEPPPEPPPPVKRARRPRKPKTPPGAATPPETPPPAATGETPPPVGPSVETPPTAQLREEPSVVSAAGGPSGQPPLGKTPTQLFFDKVNDIIYYSGRDVTPAQRHIKLRELIDSEFPKLSDKERMRLTNGIRQGDIDAYKQVDAMIQGKQGPKLVKAEKPISTGRYRKFTDQQLRAEHDKLWDERTRLTDEPMSPAMGKRIARIDDRLRKVVAEMDTRTTFGAPSSPVSRRSVAKPKTEEEARLQGREQAFLNELHAAGTNQQTVMRMLFQRFPNMTDRQVEALSVGLLRNEEWATKKLHDMLLNSPPTTPESAGWSTVVQETKEDALIEIQRLRSHWRTLNPQQRMDLFGADPTSAQIDDFEHLPVDDKLRLGRNYRRGQFNREMSAEDVIEQSKTRATEGLANLTQSERFYERLRHIFDSVPLHRRKEMWGKDFEGRGWDRLTNPERADVERLYHARLSPRTMTTMEELADFEAMVIEGGQKGQLSREAFVALLKEIAIRRAQLRGGGA